MPSFLEHFAAEENPELYEALEPIETRLQDLLWAANDNFSTTIENAANTVYPLPVPPQQQRRRGSNETESTICSEEVVEDDDEDIGDCQLVVEEEENAPNSDAVVEVNSKNDNNTVEAVRRWWTNLNTAIVATDDAGVVPSSTTPPQQQQQLQVLPPPTIMLKGRHCANCGLRTQGLCVGCFLVPYCDLNCSTQQWYGHHDSVCPLIATGLCQMISLSVQAILANAEIMDNNDNNVVVHPTTVAARTIRLMNAVNNDNSNDNNHEDVTEEQTLPKTTRTLRVAVAVTLAEMMD